MPSPNLKLLTESEVSSLTQIPVKTLRNWRWRGVKDLPWHKLGRRVRYRETDVAAYIERHRAV